MFSLENKVVVLFGGNGYLGKHFCQTLLKNGCVLYNCDINKSDDPILEALKEKEAEIERLKEVLNVIKLIITKYRRLDTKTQNN